MALIALAIPILPGKTPEWRAWMEELKGTRQQEFAESRRAAGVHERTFLQQTPMGDLVIVTLEGDDPGHAFGQMMTGTDAFSNGSSTTPWLPMVTCRCRRRDCQRNSSRTQTGPDEPRSPAHREAREPLAVGERLFRWAHR